MTKIKLTTLSWTGLVISSIALIIYIFAQITRGLIFFGVIPLTNNIPLDNINWICFSVFIIGLAISALLNPGKTRQLFNTRQLLRGSNSTVSVLGLLGVVLVINIVVFKNPTTWDISEQYNSLGQQSISILQAMPKNVNAKAYFSAQSDPAQAKRILEKFKKASNERFTYEFLDPKINIKMAQQDGVDNDGTIVLMMGDNIEKAIYPEEESIDIALLRLINPTRLVVYFLTGHGEGDIESSQPGSHSMLRTTLENKNYTVRSLNLASLENVPSDASVIVIPGPTTALTIQEIEDLRNFVSAGGAIIVLLESNLPRTDQQLENFVAEWGVSFENDIILDSRSTPPQLIFADPLNFGKHPITDKMRGTNAVFNICQSLLIGPPPVNVSITVIAQTYPEAWGKKDAASLDINQLIFDPAADIPGPLTIAIAAENDQTKGRIVVFGDTDFVKNSLFMQGNGLIFLNAIDWASRQEKLINLTPQSGIQRTFSQPSTTSLITILLISICGLPMLIIAGGIGTWITRRKKG